MHPQVWSQQALGPSGGHVAVGEQAIEEGSAGVQWRKEEVREKVKEAQWVPVYADLVYDVQGER